MTRASLLTQYAKANASKPHGQRAKELLQRLREATFNELRDRKPVIRVKAGRAN